MAEPDAVSRRLREAGWEQGDLLPALSWALNFDPDQPLSRIAKRAGHRREERDAGVRYTMAMAPLTGSDLFALVSQVCDVVKNVDQEPTVVVMRAFETANGQVLAEAKGNSPRYFLLDEARNLVVDARQIALVEKPLLAKLARLPGAPNAEARIRFARWAGRRFNRPALPDKVVRYVGSPIVSRLAELREQGDPLGDVLKYVSDVRVAQLDAPPYEVKLLFMIEEGGDRAAVDIGLARIVAEMRTWLGEEVSIVAWDAATLYEVSAGDYLNTVPLYAEHLTYGEEEAEPPRFGYEDFA